METSPQSLSQIHVTAGLTVLLQRKRQAIDAECARFVQIGDAEALHDLRVAMRRLHSLFVAFAPAIVPDSTLPDELRRLQKTTNHARDLEVTLAMVRNNSLELPWLEQAWREELENEYRQLHEHLPMAWQSLAPALDTPAQLLRKELPPQPLGELAAALLQRRAKRLKKGRKGLCRRWRDKPAHKLRIAGKQLRYLLEPFSEASPASAKAVTRLKAFQDLLGDYHDIVVLQGRLKKLRQNASTEQIKRLKQADKLLKRQRHALRQQFLNRYCSGKGKKLHKALRQARDALAKQ
ncbi:MAG: CHAD domain-containing protein [Gammaproteobacteria bacterium]|nr:CHAD domain-containing protein [Gammaproteobacteria bacterium]MCW8957783.1 CHAD domain-containing protein [Gammaproteobacteria bacterium]MCW8973102.1 CHAD domain-containing protein [Gammaproteobacteria bacterium]MCW8993213.1 CHAD domain-containing protein [Gammaproteobacteria bacterium]